MFPYLKTIPKFYQDFILSWVSENFHENTKNKPIGCNKYIKFEGKNSSV